ncbi:J domain-containing protein [Peptacetobacter sp.]|uniref:J domain-containing protein n=1 Tax=Peptacetobacter sp. TaxID=2991975 RepID=UPI0026087D3B|nr:DnaJ domain-containing protein [Peptacetobacter sp.]
MKNLYKILNININSSKKEVKARYFKLVKKYSPEKNPEKFVEIREAYEILMDSKLREEYNFKLQEELEKQNMQIKKLEKEADELSLNAEYEKAIKIYKKILKINYSKESIKSKLSTVLIKNNKFKEAEEILKELLKDSDKLEYNINLAEMYYMKKDYVNAEKYILKIKSLKKENEDINLMLANIYAENGEYLKLENIIYEFLDKYENNFKIFRYSLILIDNYMYKGNEYKIQYLLEKNLNRVYKNSNIKDYVIKESIRLAYKLYYENMFDAFTIISDNLNRLGNRNLEGILLIEKNNDFDKKNELFRLLEDKDIMDILKEPIIFNFIKYKEELFKVKKNENINEIKNCIINDPEKILISVEKIRENYTNLYSMIDKIYIAIEKFANNSINYKKDDFDFKLKYEEKDNLASYDFDELKIKYEEKLLTLKENLSKNLIDRKENFVIGVEKKIDDMKNKSIYEMIEEISPSFINKIEGFIKKNRK